MISHSLDERSSDEGLTYGYPSLLPLCYGYLRTDLVGTDAVQACDAALAEVATASRLQLGTVFHEPGSRAAPLSQAIAELAAECCRSDAHLVLTFQGHVSDMPVNRACVLDYLRMRGGARVIELPAWIRPPMAPP